MPDCSTSTRSRGLPTALCALVAAAGVGHGAPCPESPRYELGPILTGAGDQPAPVSRSSREEDRDAAAMFATKS